MARKRDQSLLSWATGYVLPACQHIAEALARGRGEVSRESVQKAEQELMDAMTAERQAKNALLA